MCGIIATFGARVEPPVLGAMLDAIAHRGPDADAVWTDDTGRCSLGHRRLAIIDLSPDGNQPFVSHCGRYRMTYNGEVYNYLDLKAELEAAHGRIAWRSTSDTEVILEGFAREGAGFLSRLNGIFALAIYDIETGTLSVLRDPLGIKPLFFARAGGVLAFASEIKALEPLPGLTLKLRRASLADQLALMYIPEPHTLFEGIEKLRPGVLYRYEDGAPRDESDLYPGLVSFRESPEARSDEAWIEAFRACFSKAVGRQMVADAPMGVLLSGGLDSSAVLHEMQQSGARFEGAFTISIQAEDMRLEQQSDDLHYARMIAERYGVPLNVIEARSDMLEDFESLVGFFEDGFSDPAALNTYLLSKMARDQGLKVLMTGQGADEFLAGYRRYLAAPGLMRLPSWASGPLRVLGGMIPASVPGRFNAMARRAHRLANLAGAAPEDRLLGLYAWADRETVRGLFADPEGLRPLQSLKDSLAPRDGETLFGRMQRTDAEFDLMALNLTYCDRMSMAASIEARVPFLDFELVRLMGTLPDRVKVRGGQAKWILKKAMEGRLPDEVIYRKKAGFGLPLRAWLMQDKIGLGRYFDPDFLARQGIFNAEKMAGIYADFSANRADRAFTIFSFYCIQLLLQKYDMT